MLPWLSLRTARNLRVAAPRQALLAEEAQLTASFRRGQRKRAIRVAVTQVALVSFNGFLVYQGVHVFFLAQRMRIPETIAKVCAGFRRGCRAPLAPAERARAEAAWLRVLERRCSPRLTLAALPVRAQTAKVLKAVTFVPRFGLKVAVAPLRPVARLARAALSR